MSPTSPREPSAAPLPTAELLDRVYARFPELHTPRLRLRRTVPGDAPDVFRVLSDPAVTRFLDLAPLARLEQAQQIVERRDRAFAERRRIRWAVAGRQDDRVLGSCGFVHWVPEAARAEIGYELHPAHQRRGLMGEALTAMLAFGFGPMGLHRVEALVAPENAASRGLLARLGFREEGLLRHHGYWQGQFHDLLMHSLLRDEFGGREFGGGGFGIPAARRDAPAGETSGEREGPPR